jgi:hypothetical protein
VSSPRTCRIDTLESRRLLAAVTFDIDSELSVLTVAAKGEVDNVGSVKLSAQDDGLDSAHFEGTLVADFSSKGVRFYGGSEINGIPHEGDFAPDGGDAVYAVKGKVKKIITLAELEASVRDLSLDITSSSRKPTTGAKHKFQIRKAEMEINSGSLDYDIDSKFGDSDGTKSLDGLEADLADTNGRVTGKKGSRIITIPIEVRFTRDFDNDAEGVFTFKGQIVGREQSASGQAFVPMRVAFSAISIANERHTAADVLNSL